MKKTFLFASPIVCLLLLWECVSRSEIINPSLFPPPTKVFSALIGLVWSGTLLNDIESSLWRLVVGLCLGSCIGVLVGLVTGRSKKISSLMVPIIQILRPLPPVAIIPLVIIWFGIGDGAKIFSISFAVFFPVWINAYLGATEVPQVFLWSADLLTNNSVTTSQSGLISRKFKMVRLYKKIIFPASLTHIVAGIRTGIAVSFIMIFVSELAGASSGLGYRISISQLSYRIDDMMAVLIVLGAIGAVVDYLFMYSIRKCFPWIKAVHAA